MEIIKEQQMERWHRQSFPAVKPTGVELHDAWVLYSYE
jgi:hypothetical protein